MMMLMIIANRGTLRPVPRAILLLRVNPSELVGDSVLLGGGLVGVEAVSVMNEVDVVRGGR